MSLKNDDSTLSFTFISVKKIWQPQFDLDVKTTNSETKQVTATSNFSKQSQQSTPVAEVKQEETLSKHEVNPSVLSSQILLCKDSAKPCHAFLEEQIRLQKNQHFKRKCSEESIPILMIIFRSYNFPDGKV